MPKRYRSSHDSVMSLGLEAFVRMNLTVGRKCLIGKGKLSSSSDSRIPQDLTGKVRIHEGGDYEKG